MSLKNILLLVYFSSVIICVFALCFDNEIVMIIFKPIIFPSILFYYYEKVKKINIFATIILLCLYLTDIITLLNLENESLILKAKR